MSAEVVLAYRLGIGSGHVIFELRGVVLYGDSINRGKSALTCTWFLEACSFYHKGKCGCLQIYFCAVNSKLVQI